jgi:aryl-alcohol dehydrogenase-like predicted oxidoreductase
MHGAGYRGAESAGYRGAAERVVLGPTGLSVGAVGVGTNSWGSRAESDPGKRSTFDALLAAGVTLFDTAEIYTAGASETTIGRCIRDSGLTPTILSKFFPFPWRWRKEAMNKALGRSLSRLQVPCVDVYLLHFPLPPVPLEAWAEALADEVKAGRARTVGVSNCDAGQTRRAHAALAARGIPLTCNEVEYSLLNRGPERSGLVAACRELGVTLVAYRPLATGMLTGKYSPERPPRGVRGLQFRGAYLAKIMPLLAAMTRTGSSHGKTPSQVAINWLLCKGALPIPGAKDAAQAEENAGAMGWRLSDSEIAELESACP